MHTIIFFDDWFLDNYQGLYRIWKQPKLIGEPYSDPYARDGSGFMTVEYNRETGKWRAWNDVINPEFSAKAFHKDIGQYLLTMCVSDDGLHWKPFREGSEDVPARRKGCPPWPHIVHSAFNSGQVYYDPREENPNRRYKMGTMLCAGKEPSGRGPYGHRFHLHLATSKDGIDWNVEALVHPEASDTYHSMTYSNSWDCYQMTMRASSPNRRIFVVHSKDLNHWSNPHLVLWPDSEDPPCSQFYGMPHFVYEGYYVGFPWLFRTQYDQPSRRKGMGKVDTHLVYSLNGIAWNRTVRHAFIPLGERGEYGEGSVYGCSMVEAPEGDLRIYARVHSGEHDAPEEDRGAMAAYRLRRDGFVCFAPEGKSGELTTCAVILQSDVMSINASCAPYGQVEVEILDAEKNALPDYSGCNAARFSGDHTEWNVTWPNASLGKLKGRIIKIRIRVTQAEIYAIRFDGYFAYSDTALLNLEGTEYGPILYPTNTDEEVVF